MLADEIRISAPSPHLAPCLSYTPSYGAETSQTSGPPPPKAPLLPCPRPVPSPSEIRGQETTPGRGTWEDEDEAGGQAPDDRDDFADVRDEESQEKSQQEPTDGLQQAPPPLPNHVLLHRHPGVAQPEALQNGPAGTEPGKEASSRAPPAPPPPPSTHRPQKCRMG